MEDPQTILDALQDHFVPVWNILYERYIFHNTEQQAHETIDQYLIKLRRLAEPCQLGSRPIGTWLQGQCGANKVV